MSAAFQLDFSGPPVPCSYPGCVAEAYHEGDHQFALKPGLIAWTYDRHCVVCGVSFTVLGAEKAQIFDTCGSQECVLHYSRKHAPTLPVSCNCAQRDYAHELSVHKAIKFESRLLRWPWSLRFAPEMEG